MQMPKRLLLAFAAIAGSLAAQTPTISLIVNGGSGIPPGLPNYAIAQGSIFVVYGTNLGAAAPAGSIVNSAAAAAPYYRGTGRHFHRGYGQWNHSAGAHRVHNSRAGGGDITFRHASGDRQSDADLQRQERIGPDHGSRQRLRYINQEDARRT
jgi:hypothetical protein